MGFRSCFAFAGFSTGFSLGNSLLGLGALENFTAEATGEVGDFAADGAMPSCCRTSALRSADPELVFFFTFDFLGDNVAVSS